MKPFLRKSLTLWAWALVLAVPGLTSWAQGPDIVETATGKTLSVAELAREVKGADVLFFGEFHDNSAIHRLEDELFQVLYSLKGRNLALSLEMGEKDTQPVLDDYLAGRIDEDAYLAQSRPWPNYKEAYRPLVEFSKQKQMSVLAAAVPRPAAAAYAKRGNMADIPDTWQPYLPSSLYPSSLAYERKFTKIMTALEGRAMPVSKENIPHLFAAQSLKDNVMAESIDAYKKAHPDHLVYHLTGAVHSGDYLGSVEQLHLRRPDLVIQVITPIFEDSSKEAEKAGRAYNNAGDYVIIVPKVSESE